MIQFFFTQIIRRIHFLNALAIVNEHVDDDIYSFIYNFIVHKKHIQEKTEILDTRGTVYLLVRCLVADLGREMMAGGIFLVSRINKIEINPI